MEVSKDWRAGKSALSLRAQSMTGDLHSGSPGDMAFFIASYGRPDGPVTSTTAFF
jgi:hypothetical protein